MNNDALALSSVALAAVVALSATLLNAQNVPAAAQSPAATSAPAAAQNASSATPSTPAAANAPAAAQSTAIGDPVTGQGKTQMCSGCHGIEGWRTAFPEVYRVPRLGGQHEAYLISALKQYKSGERSHPSMRAIAGSLSDADIANLAAYYAAGNVRTASK